MTAQVGLVTVWGIENAVRFAQFVINGWERQMIRIHNWKERINEKYILTIAYCDLGCERNLTKAKGGCVKDQLPPSDLMCICEAAGMFQTWFKGNFAKLTPITNISERNPKTVYPWFDDDDLVVWCEKRCCRVAWITCRWVSRSAKEIIGDVLTMTMGFEKGRRSRYDLSMRGDPLTSERDDK